MLNRFQYKDFRKLSTSDTAFLWEKYLELFSTLITISEDILVIPLTKYNHQINRRYFKTSSLMDYSLSNGCLKLNLNVHLNLILQNEEYEGCDGSVLIDSTKNNQAEKAGFPNLSLRGFQIIDDVKAAVEDACPGVVSCADILALVARDAIYQIKGPYWPVPLGRRDGRISIASESATLPSPLANIAQLKATFASKGLNVKDLVVLSGKGDTDPSLDSDYVPYLKSLCKPTDTTTLVEMDPGSFTTFDENYYTNVLKRRGLFVSDAALLNDYETSAYVKLQAQSHGSTFMKDFEESMVKMGQIEVLTGSAGEIRRHCRLIN
ncbi:hypothetical protein R6Q59_020516 [Mikania micrantha]